jgi:hypothetical protein
MFGDRFPSKLLGNAIAFIIMIIAAMEIVETAADPELRPTCRN